MAQPLSRIVRSMRDAGDLRWRMPPPLRVGPPVGPPTVYYLAPHINTPSGGVRVIYRHVDALNSLGIPAAVVHAKLGFRCDWFANETRVVYPADIVLSTDDILVVAECYGPGLDQLPVGPQIVVFNQRAYHTFDLIPFDTTQPGAPYAGVANLAGLLTVSEDNAALLRHAFPAVPVHFTRNVVDSSLFFPRPVFPRPATRPRRIGYVTHRLAGERDHLFHVLRARGVLDGWELVPIEGNTEAEVARILRECAIFLSFSEREGFGLPPAEAMACGCFVVGYAGLAGRDFFDPSYCAPVPDGDILRFALAVEEAVAAHDSDPVAFARRGLAAADHIRGYYTHAGLLDDLGLAYDGLVPAIPSTPTASLVSPATSDLEPTRLAPTAQSRFVGRRGRRRIMSGKRAARLAVAAAAVVVAIAGVVIGVRAAAPPSQPDWSSADDIAAAPPLRPAGWPGPSNTGVTPGTTLTEYRSSLVIDRSGVVITDKLIHGCLEIRAADVVIRNSKIECSDKIVEVQTNVEPRASVTIEDTEMDGLGSGEAIADGNYTLRRVDIHNMNEGPRIGDNVVIEDSWLHGLVFGSWEDHQDLLQTVGATNAVIRHNFLDARSDPVYFSNAAFQVGAELGPLAHLRFEGNLLDGGGYTVNIRDDPDMDDVVFRGNVFRRHAEWGAVAKEDVAGVEWDDSNVYEDTGEPVE